jgi:hypothetical protein
MNQIPFLQFGDATKNAIKDIATLLHQAAPIPQPPKTAGLLLAPPRVPAIQKILALPKESLPNQVTPLKASPIKPIHHKVKDTHQLPRVPIFTSTCMHTLPLAQHSTQYQLNHMHHPSLAPSKPMTNST